MAERWVSTDALGRLAMDVAVRRLHLREALLERDGSRVSALVCP